MTEQQDELSQQETPQKESSDQTTQERPSPERTAPASKREADKKLWWQLFIPSDKFFITPLLIDINIVLFLAMLITSGSSETLFSPGTDLLIKWGANFKPLTVHGEWWRLITSVFEHIGIIHLVFNMYALLYVGIFLEPILGKARYITAYIVTGVMGNIASLWWHDISVGAGASGAIFGLYGVFLALLTTNFIEKKTRQSLLGSIVIFVIYNLAYGTRSGVDNSAHIGGLLSGIIIGYIYYLTLRAKQSKYEWAGIAAVLAAGVITTNIMLPKINDPYGDFDQTMEQFSKYEDEALKFYSLSPTTELNIALAYLQDTTIRDWNRCSQEISKLEKAKLPEELKKRTALLREYVETRYRISGLTVEKLKAGMAKYDNTMGTLMDVGPLSDSEIDNLNARVENIISQLKAPSK